MTKSRLPERIHLCEVGPRDGFQFEEKWIPTGMKIDIIGHLIDAGFSRLQIVSFVHPERVPQMADAEAVVEAVTEMLDDPSDIVVSGLALNERGVRRASDSGLQQVDVSIATNETHGRDNANMSVEEGVRQADRMIDTALDLGMSVQLGLQTVFGYEEPGDTSLDELVLLAERFAERGIESLSLADSTGLANPDMIRERVGAIGDASNGVPIVLHLHDTRGLGLANIVAALEMGVSRFDTSLGGLGGCPFIPGATGNVASEDVIWMAEQLEIETGISIAAVAEQSRRLSDFLGRPFSGKLYTLV